MPKLPKLSNFCGCTSLKTGTLVIGCLNLVVCVIGIFTSIVVMAEPTALVDVVVEFMDKSVPGWRRNVDPKDIPTGIFIGGVIIFFASLIDTLVSACLVHGATTRNVCLMKPWIGLTAVGLFFSLFSLFYFGKVLVSLLSLDFTILAIYIILGNYFLGNYFIMVVWSFTAEVEGGEEDQGEAHLKREEREMLNA